MSDEGRAMLVSVVVVARWLDLTTRQVQSLVTQGYLTKPEPGKYDLEECTRQYILFLRKTAQGRGGASLVDERTRLTSAQAETAELELQKLKGELIDATDAEKAWGAMITAVRQGLLSLPSKAAPVAAQMKSATEIKGLLDELIYDILAGISGTAPRGGGGARPRKGRPPGSKTTRPAAPVEGKRVGRRKKVSQSRVVGGAGEVVDPEGGVSEGDDGRRE